MNRNLSYNTPTANNHHSFFFYISLYIYHPVLYVIRSCIVHKLLQLQIPSMGQKLLQIANTHPKELVIPLDGNKYLNKYN